MTDLPTVDELRAIARSAFARGAFNDLAFAERELTLLGARDVYAAEFRRHQLLQRGFTPPEDMMSNTTSLSPLLDEIERLKEELRSANDRSELAKRLRDELMSDINRPEGRYGIHGHSAVDDDYFIALEYVVERIDEMIERL